MAIGDNNEKYYSPTYTPTTYASNDYAAQNYGDGGYWGGDYYDPDKPPVTQPAGEANVSPEGNMIKREGGEHDPNPPSGEPEVRDFDNNFGYESLGLLGDIASIGGKVIGGPVGMALGAPGKIADVRNLSAVQSARKALGLETTEVGAKNVLGAMAKGTPSHVGTVSIGGVQYDVDLDPDKQGKINPKTGVATISPKEAQTIKTENKVEMTEIAAPETPAAPKGPLGKTMQAVKDKVSNIAQSVLGNPQAATTKTVKEAVETSPVAPSNPSVVGATPGYNPDAPSPAQNVGMNTRTSNPASVASSQPSANAGLAPGFGNLAGISRDQGWAGSKRPGPVDPGLESAVQDAVGRALGPGYSVSVTSGMGEYGKSNHRAANAINGLGAAMDFHVVDDLTGKTVTAKDKLDKVALSLAESGTITGIGYGKGYMGGVNFHADKVARDQQRAWGQGESKKGMIKNDPELYDAIQAEFADTRAVTKNFAETMAGKTAPTIGTREAALQQAQAQQAMNAGLSPADQMSNMQAFGLNPSVDNPTDVGAIARNAYETQYGVETPSAVAENPTIDSMSNVTAGVGSMTPGLAMGTMADDPTANVGVSQDMGTIGQGLAAMNAGYTPGTAMSPSNFSSIGMGYQYSPAEVSKMGYALAGELDSTSLKGLMENNPTAISELASMVSTVDNRVNSLTSMVKDNPLDAALNPSQYNSMMPSKQNVTAANYAQFGQKVNETIQGLLDGSVKATNVSQQANNYANMSLSNPSWADPNMAKDEAQRTAALGFKDTAVTTGAHTFGGYGLGVGAPQNAAGYGTSFGPNAATSVTGKSGLSHSPGSMYGGATTTAGTPGGYAAEGANALGGSLGLGGGYVDSGSLSGTGETNSGLGGTSSSANGNTAGSGDSGSSSSGNGNSSGSGGGSDGAGSSGSSGGLGGRGGDNDHDGGDGRGR